MRLTTTAPVFSLLLAALPLAACDSQNPFEPGPSGPPPTAVVDTFSGTVTVNGARTHSFTTNDTGLISAQLTALTPDTATIGVSLGTWNPSSGVCQIIIAKDDATLTTPAATVTGNASAGQFCVRVYDVGRLTGPTDYTITVNHF